MSRIDALYEFTFFNRLAYIPTPGTKKPKPPKILPKNTP
jgi:hypothetical protein